MSKLNTKRILLQSEVVTKKLHMFMQITPMEGRSAPTVEVNIPNQCGRADDLRELVEVLNEVAQLLDQQEKDTSPVPEVEPIEKEQEIEEKFLIELSFDKPSSYRTPGMRAKLNLSPLDRISEDRRIRISFGYGDTTEQVINSTDARYLSQFFAELAEKLESED